MLPQLERQFLQADLVQVQTLLAQCSPEEDPIEHFQYGQREKILQGKLADMPSLIAAAPAGAALFFGGRPVFGSQGIKAAFSSQAIEWFQKIISHRGLVMEDPIDAVARLQLARALVASGDTARARVAYEDFLTLWKQADTDVPLLKQAQAEAAKLR